MHLSMRQNPVLILKSPIFTTLLEPLKRKALPNHSGPYVFNTRAFELLEVLQDLHRLPA